MKQQRNIEEMLNIGAVMGRRETLALIAGKCSAAEASCLKQLRDQRAHKKLGITWTQFCRQRLGASQPTIDRIIRNWEEFGPAYFRLNEYVRLAPQEYRQIAAAISEDGVRVEGELVAFTAENTPRIASAVTALQAAVKPLEKPAAPPPPPPCPPEAKWKAARRQLADLKRIYREVIDERDFTARDRGEIIGDLDFGSQALLAMAHELADRRY